MELSVHIPTVGLFRAEQFDGSIVCFKHSVQFRGSSTELIVYPNDDGSPLSDDQKENLRRQFRDFEQSVDTALLDFPRQVRRLCDEYKLDIARVPDTKVRNELNWQLIKLLADDGIECYTHNDRVSESLDIVLGFSPRMVLEWVHFDG